MATIIQNLNSIITTKNELNSILQENGVDGGEIFSEYPQKFRSVIAGSDKVSYSYLNEKLTYYVEKDELYNSSYATQSYVVDYVNTYAPTPDLSAYATKSYVANYVATYAPQPDLSSYVSYSYLESKHYLDSIPNTYATYEAISGMGYLTSIPNDYPTYAAISEMSYATTSYVADYVAEHGGGGSTVIDENIIPKENNTYTLGDENHLYSATYSARLKIGNNSQIYNDDGGITLSVNSNSGIRMGSSNFYPKNNNGMNLGQSSNAWNNTYTSNLYLGSDNIKDLINGMFSYNSSTGTLTITTLS